MSRRSRLILLAQTILLGVPVAVAFILGAGYYSLLLHSGWSIGAFMVPLCLVWFGAAAALLSFFVLAVTALRKGRSGLRSSARWPWVGVAIGSAISVGALTGWIGPDPAPENATSLAFFRANLRLFFLGAMLLPATAQLAFERLRNEA